MQLRKKQQNSCVPSRVVVNITYGYKNTTLIGVRHENDFKNTDPHRGVLLGRNHLPNATAQLS